jgi:hypothetical protein
LGELGRICAAARADIRLVTTVGTRLSPPAEPILATAEIKVRAALPTQRLPATADELLAPVLRVGVTNVLRYSTTTACVILWGSEMRFGAVTCIPVATRGW